MQWLLERMTTARARVAFINRGRELIYGGVPRKVLLADGSLDASRQKKIRSRASKA